MSLFHSYRGRVSWERKTRFQLLSIPDAAEAHTLLKRPDCEREKKGKFAVISIEGGINSKSQNPQRFCPACEF